MSYLSIAAQRAALIRSVSTCPIKPKPEWFPPSSLQESNNPWLGVEEWVNSTGFRSADTDVVLRWLIRYSRDQPGSHPQELLLLLAWNSLVELHGILRRLERNAGSSWPTLYWSFLKAMGRIDLGRRSTHIGQKLLNDSQHDTRLWYRHEREKHPGVIIGEDEDDPTERIPSPYVEQASAGHRIERQWAIKRLRSLVRSGTLTRPDFQILLGCHLYGRSIDEMAAHLGIPYGVAKKRRQRAVKKLQKSAPHLSPNDPDSPLYPVERISRKEAEDEIELPLSRNR